ncbi:MAG: hypothetical protein HC848_06990 [Limnobacter sp.]|nr:hypothetical protein [Limnobacter sp.]
MSKHNPIKAQDYAAFFDSVKLRVQTIEGVRFFIVDGYHFNYQVFRDKAIREAVQKYYRIPEFLPVLDCPYGRKYGFEQECRVPSPLR